MWTMILPYADWQVVYFIVTSTSCRGLGLFLGNEQNEKKSQNETDILLFQLAAQISDEFANCGISEYPQVT